VNGGGHEPGVRPLADFMSLDELAERCGLRPESVRRFVRLGLIDAEETTERFAPETTVRVQRIVRLRQDLGVNYSGIGVVLELLERIDVLEARLRRFEGSGPG
jgi:DNA-binding transcriptional MerR regulator